MPSGEQLRVLREAGDRLQQFEWDFAVDLSDEELRRGLLSGEMVGSQSRGLDTTEAFTKISSPGLRAIREHYYEKFTPLPEIAHAFFEALAEAGGQRLLARRAGLQDIEPSSFPSSLVRFGPVRLPKNRTRSFDTFAEDQGGTHVAAARLIWWCAASHRPWEFGYTVDLSWYVWCRIPWIGTLNGRVTLLDGPLDAVRDCVGYLIELVESHQEDAATSEHVNRVFSSEPVELPTILAGFNRSTSPENTEQGFSSSAESWAFGVDFDRNWHLFERFKDRFTHRRKIKFSRGPQVGVLLNLFREGRGVLTIFRAYEGLYAEGSSPSDTGRMRALIKQQPGRIFGRIKSLVSHLKSQLSVLTKIAPEEIIQFEKGQGQYRLFVQLGTAIEGKSDSGGGINTETGSLEFFPDT